jgi:hypothetical protein
MEWGSHCQAALWLAWGELISSKVRAASSGLCLFNHVLLYGCNHRVEGVLGLELGFDRKLRQGKRVTR